MVITRSKPLRSFLRGSLVGCIALLFAPLWLAPGCTAAQRSTANTVVSGVAVATDPVCLLAGGGSVCGTVSTDVSDVAKLVNDILASLPKSARVVAAGVKAFVYRGVAVTLPADVSDAVRAALPQ